MVKFFLNLMKNKSYPQIFSVPLCYNKIEAKKFCTFAQKAAWSTAQVVKAPLPHINTHGKEEESRQEKETQIILRQMRT